MTQRNWYRVAVLVFGFASSGLMLMRLIPLGAMAGGIMLGLAWAYVDMDDTDWESIATDLYNAHSGSAGQWERSRERYEKAVGK
jgi:hypothetical protein